jgi:hypothetical protein
MSWAQAHEIQLERAHTISTMAVPQYLRPI